MAELELDIDSLLENPTEQASKRTLEETIERLEKIANADIREAYRHDGTLKSPTEWSDDFTMAVEKVGNQAGQINSLSLVPKGRTLESLAKIKGAFDKDQQVTPFEKLLAQIPREDLRQILDAMVHLAKARGIREQDEDEEEAEKKAENDAEQT